MTSFITLDGHLVADKKSISGSISGLQFWPIFGFKPNLIFVSWIIQCRDVGRKHPLHINVNNPSRATSLPFKTNELWARVFFFFFHTQTISAQ